MESKDYSKFKIIKENRGIKKATVNKIVISINQFGFIPGRPVLVDKDFNIVDGQHRFFALKQLNMPIQYEIIDGDIIAKTMMLNSSQSQWLLKDYIESYASQGMFCYIRLIRFEEKYKLGNSNNITINIENRLKPKDLRIGREFVINENADDIANFLYDCNAVSFWKNAEFVKAITGLFRKANEEQLNIIKKNILKVPRCSNITEYYTVFENILNYKKRSANLIYLNKR